MRMQVSSRHLWLGPLPHDIDVDALYGYSKIFFVLQRSGLVGPNVESSPLLQRCITAAKDAGNTTFVVAASVDYTVDAFLVSGNRTKVTFDNAQRLPVSVCQSKIV